MYVCMHACMHAKEGEAETGFRMQKKRKYKDIGLFSLVAPLQIPSQNSDENKGRAILNQSNGSLV